MVGYKTTLSIDPGGTTGIALRLSDGSIMTSICKTPEELWDFITSPGIEQVVYERFAARHIDTNGLYTVRLCGGIEAVCYLLEIPCKGQQPQQRRPYLQDAQALRKPRTMVHELDALAHLLCWEDNNGT